MTEINENTSDGYHTFGELYAHRRALTVALCAIVQGMAWRSREHHPDSDPMFDGYFIVGIDLPNGTITYHYKLEYWSDFDGVAELDHAPKWDGTSPDGTIIRLHGFARIMHSVAPFDEAVEE
jgi:hypothetical protein